MKKFFILIISCLLLAGIFSCKKTSENPVISKSPCQLLSDSTDDGTKNTYFYDAANNLVKVKTYSGKYFASGYSFIYTNGNLSALIPLNYDETDNVSFAQVIATDDKGNITKVIQPSGDSISFGFNFTTLKDYLRKDWVQQAGKISSFNYNAINDGYFYGYDGNGNATGYYSTDINAYVGRAISIFTYSYDNKPSPYSYNNVLNWYNSYINHIPNNNNNLLRTTFYTTNVGLESTSYKYNDKGLPTIKTPSVGYKTYYTYNCK